jgi:hypothetical protein
MPRPVAHLANLDLNLLVALRELLRGHPVHRRDGRADHAWLRRLTTETARRL